MRKECLLIASTPDLTFFVFQMISNIKYPHDQEVHSNWICIKATNDNISDVEVEHADHSQQKKWNY